ncbi:P-loop containing nucleoside triphosphate hydrolases superfamily protein [Wolffia australiana]
MAGAALLWIVVFLPTLAALLLLLPRLWRSIKNNFQSYHHYKIPRYDENLQENPLFRRSSAYISSLTSLEDSDYANIFSSASKKKIWFQIDLGRTVRDSFLGAPILWTCLADGFVIRVRRRVLRPYLLHVESVADEIQLRKRDLRLFTISAVGSGLRRWRSVPFTHPATLDAIAMDPDLKNRVRTDLESFLKNKAFYNRLGRVWKRSYLLHGPPGTGKSTFAAAMAKFLNYDLYDLDFNLSSGADLKDLLLQTTPQSVILVEDLDRHLRASPEPGQSAILNFMDGVFSCCGEERVMVFTASAEPTDRVEPAAIRAGRVDVRIPFPLCNFQTFKAMAGSYLGLKDHKLFPQLEDSFHGGSSINQAEIAEIMIANRSSSTRALKTIIAALKDNRTAPPCPINSEEQLAESGSEGGIRKLYGFIKLRSGSKREGAAVSPPADAADKESP